MAPICKAKNEHQEEEEVEDLEQDTRVEIKDLQEGDKFELVGKKYTVWEGWKSEDLPLITKCKKRFYSGAIKVLLVSNEQEGDFIFKEQKVYSCKASLGSEWVNIRIIEREDDKITFIYDGDDFLRQVRRVYKEENCEYFYLNEISEDSKTRRGVCKAKNIVEVVMAYESYYADMGVFEPNDFQKEKFYRQTATNHGLTYKEVMEVQQSHPNNFYNELIALSILKKFKGDSGEWVLHEEWAISNIITNKDVTDRIVDVFQKGTRAVGEMMRAYS